MDATSQTIREKAKRISPLDAQWGGSLSRRGNPIFSGTEICEAEQFRQQPCSKGRAIHLVNGHQTAGLQKGVPATILVRLDSVPRGRAFLNMSPLHPCRMQIQ
jgi:hypothetical protein